MLTDDRTADGETVRNHHHSHPDEKESCVLCTAPAAPTERTDDAGNVAYFDRIAADALADAVGRQVQAGKIDTRSEIGDALLAYRDPPHPLRPAPAAPTHTSRKPGWEAHVPCTNEMHDPLNGLLAGFCVRCRLPWPCPTSPEHEPAAPAAPTHTSGWLLRDEHINDLPPGISLSYRGICFRSSDGRAVADIALALRAAIDAALFRLECEPCGECGGEGKRYGGEYGDRESWLHCSSCCLPDGRSRWHELRVEPGLRPVKCGTCDGLSEETYDSCDGPVSPETHDPCPAGCHQGTKTYRCEGCGEWIDEADLVGPGRDGHEVPERTHDGYPYLSTCGPVSRALAEAGNETAAARARTALDHGDAPLSDVLSREDWEHAFAIRSAGPPDFDGEGVSRDPEGLEAWTNAGEALDHHDRRLRARKETS